MAGEIRVAGLGGYVERVLERVARLPGEKELTEIHTGIVAASGRIEASLRLKKITPEQLTSSTRKLRGWIGLMSDPLQLNACAAAVKLAQPLLDTAAARTRWHRPIHLYLCPVRGLYKMKDAPSGAVLRLPTPAVCFDTNDFTALAETLFHKSPVARKHVLDRMQSEEFQSIAAEIEVLGGVVEETRGEHHDLADSFMRINRDYFGGKMARPRIYWSRALTRRKFGHYDWIGDALMISRTLDSVHVPMFVVDFVMYHEMLHKHHGVRWTGGKRFAHTPEFRRAERHFPHFEQAERIIERLARGR